MITYVKLTNKLRKDLEDFSEIHRKMFDTITYINPNPYHMLDKRCNCPSCHQSFGHYTSIKEIV